MSVLVVGTVAFDTIETPFGRADRILGGSATYASLAARVVGAPVQLSAVVGGDFPETHVQALVDHGVDVEGLVRDPEGETFFWAGRYHYDLNTRDTLATHLNVLATFEPDLPASYRSPDVLCVGNLDPGVQSAIIDQAGGDALGEVRLAGAEVAVEGDHVAGFEAGGEAAAEGEGLGRAGGLGGQEVGEVRHAAPTLGPPRRSLTPGGPS